MNDDTSYLEAAHLQRSTLAISQSLMNGKWKHRLCSPSGIGGFPFLWLQQMFHGNTTVPFAVKVFLIQFTIKDVFDIAFAFLLPGCTVTQHFISYVLHTFK